MAQNNRYANSWVANWSSDNARRNQSQHAQRGGATKWKHRLCLMDRIVSLAKIAVQSHLRCRIVVPDGAALSDVDALPAQLRQSHFALLNAATSSWINHKRLSRLFRPFSNAIHHLPTTCLRFVQFSDGRVAIAHHSPRDVKTVGGLFLAGRAPRRVTVRAASGVASY
jgi:hypothetical protein